MVLVQGVEPMPKFANKSMASLNVLTAGLAESLVDKPCVTDGWLACR